MNKHWALKLGIQINFKNKIKWVYTIFFRIIKWCICSIEMYKKKGAPKDFFSGYTTVQKSHYLARLTSAIVYFCRNAMSQPYQ